MSERTPDEPTMPAPFVLVGGRSTRFGRDKLREPIGEGRWLVDRAIDALRVATGAAVTLVGRCAPEVAARGDRAIDDAYPDVGPAGGILTALEHARGDVLVLAGDLPRIDEDAVRALIARGLESPMALVVRARGEPCIAIYRAAIAPRIAARLREGRRSLFDIASGDELAEVSIETRAVANANTRGALLRALVPIAGLYPFEHEIDERLELVPIAARRALDRAGIHLSLEGWRALPLATRRELLAHGCAPRVDVAEVRAALGDAAGTRDIDAVPELDETSLPELLAGALGDLRPEVTERWPELRAVDRFALVHAARSAARRGDPERLAAIVRAVLDASRE